MLVVHLYTESFNIENLSDLPAEHTCVLYGSKTKSGYFRIQH
jgi:hypothetical protein